MTRVPENWDTAVGTAPYPFLLQSISPQPSMQPISVLRHGDLQLEVKSVASRAGRPLGGQL